MQALHSMDIQTWQPSLQPEISDQLALALELGQVLRLPKLHFDLEAAEQIFYSPEWLSGKRKNISLEGDKVGGARGSPELLRQMGGMIRRFSEQSTSLIHRLFPKYTGHLNKARTSFRPSVVQGPQLSWKKDDSRLHVDAFPSRPNHGERILRVFTNVNPSGVARVWRVGEPFEQAAKHFLAQISRPLSGSARLLYALKITKRPRSEYGHIML